MEQADIDRVRRGLQRRPKPPWRVLWRTGPPESWATSSKRRWSRRRRLQHGWRLLWTERLRRDLDPVFRLVVCRRGLHRDAYLMDDDLIGSTLADVYPRAAICLVCGRTIEWPHGELTPDSPQGADDD